MYGYDEQAGHGAHQRQIPYGKPGNGFVHGRNLLSKCGGFRGKGICFPIMAGLLRKGVYDSVGFPVLHGLLVDSVGAVLISKIKGPVGAVCVIVCPQSVYGFHHQSVLRLGALNGQTFRLFQGLAQVLCIRVNRIGLGRGCIIHHFNGKLFGSGCCLGSEKRVNHAEQHGYGNQDREPY